MMLFRSLVFFATLFNFANAFVVSGSGRSQAVSLNAGKETVESVRKKEFVSIMAEELGYTKTDAEAALNCAINIITNNLVDGKKVVLPGFGTFEPRERRARMGRNPKTGEPININASVGAGFSAAKGLKDKLNGRE
eukprot:CAMPEP_0168166374 /NCGR_PEP_ID=MMETSP0139_2-20121125/1992_1 /TAXON_ID=44445 /ORGANISM="Pseudo-nitzschia australis, Strain 10249 10 AB" /LENGTH=135 /DNA_ID=CAMNT_0008083565 /DNA_START=180 /DNA_END=587 /DNA_ORIENTATION=+